MIDLIHVKRHHDIEITPWTSWIWKHEHEHEYRYEHETLNDMNKRLREAYT